MPSTIALISPKGKLILVDTGFCWGGFFFGGFWALYRRLWQKAAQLLIAWVSVAVTDELFIKNSNIPGLISAVLVFYIGCMCVCGKFGNAWRLDGLLKRGYQIAPIESVHESDRA